MPPKESPKQVRGERLVEKVLEATLAELARVGFEELSIENVALRAEVNKTTIYRRWPTPAELTRAALLRVANAGMVVPDTGSLRGDLGDLIRKLRILLASANTLALLRMHLGGTLHGSLAKLAASIQKEKDEQTKVILVRAVTRRELPRGTDVDLLYDTITGALLHLAVSRRSGSRGVRLERAVEMILVGAENGGGRKNSPQNSRVTRGRDRR